MTDHLTDTELDALDRLTATLPRGPYVTRSGAVYAQRHSLDLDELVAMGTNIAAAWVAAMLLAAPRLTATVRELRARLDHAERERDEARAEQRDAEASRDLLVAGYTRAIREWLATHPGDSVPDVVDLFRAVMAERDEAGRAFRDLVAVLDRDGGQRQAGETIAGTLERATRLAADLVVGEPERVAAAVATEREACAALCETAAWRTSTARGVSGCLAGHIRARATSTPEAAPVASAERAVVEAAVEWRACLSAKRATGSVLCPPGKSCGAALEAAVDALAAARKGGRK